MRCARLVATEPHPRDDAAAERRPRGAAVVAADHGRRGRELCRGDAVLPGHAAAARAADRDARRAGHPGLAARQRPRPGGGGGDRRLRSRWHSPPSYRSSGGASACSSSSPSRSARRCACARTSSRSRSAACSCSASARWARSPPPGSASPRRWWAPPSGIAANLLFPPKIASADAGRAIDGLADSVSDLLNRAADELTELVAEGRDVAPAARAWLDEARRITHDIPRVGAALLHAEQGRRLNVRAVGTPDVGPGLRQGLEALEHSAVAIRCDVPRAGGRDVRPDVARRRERRRRAPRARADVPGDGRRYRRVRAAGPRRGRPRDAA